MERAGGNASAVSLERLLDVEVESVFGASPSLQTITEAAAALTSDHTYADRVGEDFRQDTSNC